MHQEMKFSSFCGHLYQQILETCFCLARNGGIGLVTWCPMLGPIISDLAPIYHIERIRGFVLESKIEEEEELLEHEYENESWE